MLMAHEQHLQDWLSAVTDALNADTHADVHPLADYYGVSGEDAAAFTPVIRRLEGTLVGAPPSPRFVARLRAELVGAQQPVLVRQMQKLPARVRVAAVVAIAAGFFLITRRRLFDNARREEQSEVAAQRG